MGIVGSVGSGVGDFCPNRYGKRRRAGTPRLDDQLDHLRRVALRWRHRLVRAPRTISEVTKESLRFLVKEHRVSQIGTRCSIKMNNSTIQLTTTSKAKQDTFEKTMAIIAVIGLITAWLYGYFSAGIDLQPSLRKLFPAATEIRANSNTYVVKQGETILGYAKSAQADGYAGPVTVLAAIDPQGKIIGIEIVNHKETPAFFRRVIDERFVQGLIGRAYSDSLTIGVDVDAVSGATFTSRAIVNSLRQSARAMAVEKLGAAAIPEVIPIQWGIPEITLVALYVIGFFAHRPNFIFKKQLRWATLLTGLILIGFGFNRPLTISNIASLASGYLPDWRVNLYWYLLIGGTLFIATSEGKNAYCAWFCPFGAAQECLAVVSGAKQYTPKWGRSIFQWIQRGLAWGALILGLALRSPGVSTYEPFGALFQLKGTTFHWVLLAIVLLMSLVILRPWCNFLCPLDPIFDLITATRRWSLQAWQKITNSSSSTSS